MQGALSWGLVGAGGEKLPQLQIQQQREFRVKEQGGVSGWKIATRKPQKKRRILAKPT